MSNKLGELFSCKKSCCHIFISDYQQKSDKKIRFQTQKSGVFICTRVDDEYAVLLVQSRGNLWGIPKGTLERHEDFISCALREVREETGLTLEPKLLSRRYFIKNQACYYYYQSENIIPVTLQTQIENNDVNGIGWLKISCLNDMLKRGEMRVNHHSRLCFTRYLGIYLSDSKYPKL